MPLVPVAAILIAVPIFRVHQIPHEAGRFIATQNSPDAIATGELYRKAAELVAENEPSFRLADVEHAAHLRGNVPPDLEAFLSQNDAALQLTLEASSRATCFFEPGESIEGTKADSTLYWLLLGSAWQKEATGRYVEAFDRYLAALRMAGHLSLQNNRLDGNGQFIFAQMQQWSTHTDLTPEQIRTSIEKLAAIDSNILHTDDRLKARYLLARRAILDDPLLRSEALSANPGARRNQQGPAHPFADDFLWGRLMPWENDRAARLLSLLTWTALERIESMQIIIARQNAGKADTDINPHSLSAFLPPTSASGSPEDSDFNAPHESR